MKSPYFLKKNWLTQQNDEYCPIIIAYCYINQAKAEKFPFRMIFPIIYY